MAGSKFKIYVEELRVPFFTATIVPVFIGGAIAWARTGQFLWGYFLLTLLGGLCLHAGTNVANDYFDHTSGNDEANTEFIRPFGGGSRIIQKGLMKPLEVFWFSIALFAAGSLIGLYLAAERGWLLLAIGIVGVISGFFYAAPPLRLGYRGFGELLIGLNFGVLMTLGTYFVQTQSLAGAWEPVAASLSVAIMIAAVVYINQFQDMNADKATGKNTWVVRLGRKRASTVFAASIALAYLSIAVAAVSGIISFWALAGLLSVPLGIKAARVALRSFDDNLKLVPANAATIGTHLATGLLLAAGYLFAGIFSGR